MWSEDENQARGEQFQYGTWWRASPMKEGTVSYVTVRGPSNGEDSAVQFQNVPINSPIGTAGKGGGVKTWMVGLGGKLSSKGNFPYSVTLTEIVQRISIDKFGKENIEIVQGISNEKFEADLQRKVTEGDDLTMIQQKKKKKKTYMGQLQMCPRLRKRIEILCRHQILYATPIWCRDSMRLLTIVDSKTWVSLCWTYFLYGKWVET